MAPLLYLYKKIICLLNSIGDFLCVLCDYFMWIGGCSLFL
ncbi:hypothetical protein BACOVA_05351 [Bacteroides ovatus ATCC 8483]|uniref:Uncharacterized protein n=1 Tax=Bacteroides ovatus (strain ATCC 8483 / DSM 1896 / JCM 5824 / BCRC 10623 / CCUG 4943 / NCTC 11153) TaxID=411476 RepID=A0AAN3A3G6_BACO1|nr:hypothetical protein BACOVA_05351 [Bacteroides ovatus ATCC 8483]